MKKIYNRKKSLPSNMYYIYGKHSAVEAMKNTKRKIIEIFCTENIYSEHLDLVQKFEFHITNNIEIDNILEEKVNHQGILVKTQELAKSDFSSIDLNKDKSLIIVLDNVTDPQNVGAIIRNASSFNADAIITSKTNSVLENSIICKVSTGAIEKVNLIRLPNIIHALDFLKNNGYWIIGLDGHAENPINVPYLKGKIVLVLGSEGEGLRKLVKEKADILYKIPISNIESLNVSSASAIAIYAYYLANQ
jgi:23S rRNA (guanosine2251-2'-O)-methyltransferase